MPKALSKVYHVQMVTVGVTGQMGGRGRGMDVRPQDALGETQGIDGGGTQRDMEGTLEGGWPPLGCVTFSEGPWAQF